MDHRGSCCDLCLRVFCLCSPLGLYHGLPLENYVQDHLIITSKFIRIIRLERFQIPWKMENKTWNDFKLQGIYNRKFQQSGLLSPGVDH